MLHVLYILREIQGLHMKRLCKSACK